MATHKKTRNVVFRGSEKTTQRNITENGSVRQSKYGKNSCALCKVKTKIRILVHQQSDILFRYRALLSPVSDTFKTMNVSTLNLFVKCPCK